MPLKAYPTFELIYYLRMCSLPKTNPENQRAFSLSQFQNRSVGRGSKLELRRRRRRMSKHAASKSEGDEMKDPKVEQEVQR